jgi:hypothetical protein
MYRIYAFKSNDLNLDYEALLPYECCEQDESVKKCIELFRDGYTIHKVALPSGKEIAGNRVESALQAAWSDLRAA